MAPPTVPFGARPPRPAPAPPRPLPVPCFTGTGIFGGLPRPLVAEGERLAGRRLSDLRLLRPVLRVLESVSARGVVVLVVMLFLMTLPVMVMSIFVSLVRFAVVVMLVELCPDTIQKNSFSMRSCHGVSFRKQLAFRNKSVRCRDAL